MLFNIPFRGLGRKIYFKTAPKSPEGDLKLQPYRLMIFWRIGHYLIPTTYMSVLCTFFIIYLLYSTKILLLRTL